MRDSARCLVLAALAIIGLAGASELRGQAVATTPPAAASRPAAATTQPTTASQPASGPVDPNLAPLEIKLPKPLFIGTPKNIPPGTTVEKPTGKARPPFLAPKGTANVALKKPVTASDKEPVIGSAAQVTDGDKESVDGSFVEFGPGLQYVQIDLKAQYQLFAILLWHYHGDPRVYRDVVVQVADDPDFITNVRTLFNNDQDNSSGLGIGKDREYFEGFEGKLIPGKLSDPNLEEERPPGPVKARYVRCYSKGSTSDDQNQYCEVEVYGLPVK